MNIAQKLEHIARVAHEANRFYCKSIGDDAHQPWDLAAQWQRDSVLMGVKSHHADPDFTPEQCHAAWLAVKEADGWVYGDVKDADAKTHPCMLPYAELPDNQRAKDHVFSNLVKAMLFVEGLRDGN